MMVESLPLSSSSSSSSSPTAVHNASPTKRRSQTRRIAAGLLLPHSKQSQSQSPPPPSRQQPPIVKLGFVFAICFAVLSLRLTSNFARITTTSTTSQAYDNDEEASGAPAPPLARSKRGDRAIVWLMSFPNSGTTYTIANTQHMSNASAGTNYATELLLEQQDPLPVFKGMERTGPFLTDPTLQVPSLVLTKTHCAGYCDYCLARNSVLKLEQFQEGCTLGTRVEEKQGGGNVTTTTTHSHYSNNIIVSKAVHLFRHPLDNMVARMHRGKQKRASQGGWTLEQLAVFNDTIAGFRAWCDYIDVRFNGTLEQLIDLSIQEKEWIQQLPCYSDLYRYVQWHNLAIQTIQQLQVPVHVVYYEDYTTSLEQTSNHLLKFLELSRAQPPLDFTPGKTYEHLYSPKQARAAALLVRAWATPESWTYLRNYVAPWLPKTKTSAAWLAQQQPQAVTSVVGGERGNHTTTDDEEQQPEIVWLMSFPNSGTSYTIMNTQQVTGMSTATNYAKEVFALHNPLVPVRSDLPLGPYWLYPHLTTKPKYVLTKTHCTGYCDGCKAIDTLQSANSFSQGCRFTTFGGTQPHVTKSLQDAYLPAKAVHLFRNPVDNLVARKHLGVKSRIASGEFALNASQIFDDSVDGLLEWCDWTDRNFEVYESRHFETLPLFSKELKLRFTSVPCYSEWYRYIQWHNLALKTIDRFDIPSHVMYYESYTSNYNATLSGLLEFLELPQRQPSMPFVAGKTYTLLFGTEYIAKAARIARFAATRECWELVKHYFDPELYGLNDDEEDSEDSEEEEKKEEDHTPQRHTTTQANDDQQAAGSGDNDDDDDDDSEDSSNDEYRPEAVWLMSFPNSGTSYTIQNIEAMTNTTTATNHGQEANGTTTVVPLRWDLPSGPYLHYPSLRVPLLVLTKTHCTGYCDSCNQTMSSKTLKMFAAGCLTSKKPAMNGELQASRYALSVPKKAVHLIRSPFDNIVARMHLGIKLRQQSWTTTDAQLLSQFNDTRQGVLAWCRYVDTEFAQDRNHSLSGLLNTNVFRSVPCHAEWFRYTQWHNHAYDLINRLELPRLTLFYEDYTRDWNGTVQSLLDFIEATTLADPWPFVSGKTNGSLLFSASHRRAIRNLIQALASQDVWTLLRMRYFQETTTS